MRCVRSMGLGGQLRAVPSVEPGGRDGGTQYANRGLRGKAVENGGEIRCNGESVC